MAVGRLYNILREDLHTLMWRPSAVETVHTAWRLETTRDVLFTLMLIPPSCVCVRTHDERGISPPSRIEKSITHKFTVMRHRSRRSVGLARPRTACGCCTVRGGIIGPQAPRHAARPASTLLGRAPFLPPWVSPGTEYRDTARECASRLLDVWRIAAALHAPAKGARPLHALPALSPG